MKVVLITGCSSGFGLLTAVELAKAGHTVYATMRNLFKQSFLQEQIKIHQLEKNIHILPLDVVKPESINSVVSQIVQEQGVMDCLINNAGYGIGGFFEDLTQQEIRDQMETNFFGVQNVTRRCIPIMRDHKDGCIINISSISGLTAAPCFGAYVSSKWALEGFSESLRLELSGFGIDVYLVEPGSYPTEIFTNNAKVAENFNNPESVYFETSQRLKHLVDDTVSKLKKDPNEVAVLCRRLMEKRPVRFRHIPDWPSWFMYWARKYLPFRLYEKLYRKVLIT